MLSTEIEVLKLVLEAIEDAEKPIVESAQDICDQHKNGVFQGSCRLSC